MNDKRQNIFERNPNKTVFMLLSIVVLILDLSVASIYTQVKGHGLFENPAAAAARIEKSYRIGSDIYHHDLAKRASVDNARWGGIEYAIATDSLGFKNREVKEISLTAVDKRIVFIGDSFTEGVGVEYQGTFVGKIASQLEKENIEVLNAGVVSYSPTIYWRKLKYLLEDLGLKFDELVVYIDISDIQDDAIYYWLSENETVAGLNVPQSSEHTLKSFITRHTILTYIVLNFLHNLIASPIDDSGLDDQPLYDHYQRSMWTIDEAVFEEMGKKGLENSEHFLDLIATLTNTHEIKLTIAVYPWREQIEHNDLDSIQVNFWKEWAKKADVAFLNYFPCFIKQDNSRAENSSTIDKHFFVGDAHWNETGHNVIARNFLSSYRNTHSDDNACIEVN